MALFGKKDEKKPLALAGPSAAAIAQAANIVGPAVAESARKEDVARSLTAGELEQLQAEFDARGQMHMFRNVLLFSRLLREMGLDANPTRTIDLLRAFDYINIAKKYEFYDAAQTIMVRRHEEYAIFEYVFNLFWRRWPNTGERDRSMLDDIPDEYWDQDKAKDSDDKKARKPPIRQQREETGKAQEAETLAKRIIPDDDPRTEKADKPDSASTEKMQTYSTGDAIKKKDFQDFTGDELAEARRLMTEMNWSLGERPSRRMAATHRRSRRLNMRRTMRNSLRYGGVPLDLSWQQRKWKPRALVLICDISGSMDLYARLLLQFMHSLENGLKYVETFVFGTRLTRITHELKNKDVDFAVKNVTKVVQDFSGGTKIGESLATFNRHWARRVLGHGAVVIIISDGWDRGNVEVLRTEMARLQRLSFRLIWLNPLLGQDDYQPLTMGIRAAMNHIDDFLPAHNFESLVALGRILETVHMTRPERGNRSPVQHAMAERSRQINERRRLRELEELDKPNWIERL